MILVEREKIRYSSVKDEMQREENQKETSVNVLVSQVLKRYTEWDRYQSKIGMMPVPKTMLSSLARTSSSSTSLSSPAEIPN
jgi:hypothetical protein